MISRSDGKEMGLNEIKQKHDEVIEKARGGQIRRYYCTRGSVFVDSGKQLRRQTKLIKELEE